VPASRAARLVAVFLLAAALGLFALATFPPDALRGEAVNRPDLESITQIVLRYTLITAVLGFVLQGVLATCFGLLGVATLRTAEFPAPGQGLPWSSRRIRGYGARLVGSFLLFAALVIALRLLVNVTSLVLALSL
jgi:hypothetical protein